MRIEVMQNKSVAIIGTLVSESATVAEYRQFKIGDKVEYDGTIYRILTADTHVCGDMCIHNSFGVYDKQLGYHEIVECLLLEQNPQPCPNNIYDIFHDVLHVPPFVMTDNVFVIGHEA